METRLSSLESDPATDPEVEDLKGEVFDLLPDIEPGSMGWKQEQRELEDELYIIQDDPADRHPGHLRG